MAFKKSFKEFDEDKIPAARKFPTPPPPPFITFLMVRSPILYTSKKQFFIHRQFII